MAARIPRNSPPRARRGRHEEGTMSKPQSISALRASWTEASVLRRSLRARALGHALELNAKRSDPGMEAILADAEVFVRFLDLDQDYDAQLCRSHDLTSAIKMARATDTADDIVSRATAFRRFIDAPA